MEKVSEKELKEHLYVLILCGGGGTRLWPRSRKKSPKQFINLLGVRSETIYAQTVKIAKKLTSEDKIFVVANADYIDEAFSQSELSLKNIIAEPLKRNTALAMATGAAVIEEFDPKAVIVNIPADNLISPIEVFVQDMRNLARMIYSGEYLGMIGTKPTFPHTGFGYVLVGKEVGKIGKKKFFRVREFKEKPDLSTAKKFVRSGKYFWNASFYTWRASALLDACRVHAPQVYTGAKRIQKVWGTKDEREVMGEVYSEAKDLSIDYAVSEKIKNLILLSSSFSWDDIGSWKSVWEASRKDGEKNAIMKFGKGGEIFTVDSKRNLVQSDGQLITLVGVEDLVVIDTEDVLLVCHKDKAQDVKKIVSLLKEKGKAEYL